VVRRNWKGKVKGWRVEGGSSELRDLALAAR